MQNNFKLIQAKENQTEQIWQILQFAIASRKKDGSKQWQDGYPNLETVKNDIQNELGYVLMQENEIRAYAAIIFDIEPAYEKIEGNWLSTQAYTVVHRVAVSVEAKGKGVATVIMQKAEELARKKNIHSIRVDTNFDNAPMLRIVEKLGYTYCGEVYFRGDARKAFEKILT